MANNVIEINEASFDKEVKNGEGAVLVDFWAPWCMPCTLVAPVLGKLAGELSGRLKVCKLNIDNNQKLASEVGIMSIPTLVIFKEGKECDRIVGVLGESELRQRIEKNLG